LTQVLVKTRPWAIRTSRSCWLQANCYWSFYGSESNPFRWGCCTGKKLGEGQIYQPGL